MEPPVTLNPGRGKYHAQGWGLCIVPACLSSKKADIRFTDTEASKNEHAVFMSGR